MNKLLIWQYHQKPKAKATINTISQESNRVFLSAIDFANLLNINTAYGFALDLVGKHVGASRLVKKYIPKLYFGFNEDRYSKGFERGEWYLYGEQIRDDTLLDDEDYRFMIKAQILKNYQQATIDNITEAIHFLFGKTAQVIDQYDMTMNIVVPFDLINEFKIFAVKHLDVLVRPIGVKYNYFEIAREPFGWYEDHTTLGFNSGRWSDFI